MEEVLRRNAPLRWILILGLCLGIVAEGVLIYNRVAAEEDGASVDTGQPPDPGEGGGADTVTLPCVVVSDVYLRSGPDRSYDPPLDTLSVGQELRAIARNGEAPWLLVQLPDGREGWSSTRSSNDVLIECEGDLNDLPEREPETAAAPTDTPPPTETPPPTPAPPEGIAVLPPPERVRTDNGPDLAASRAPSVTVDGQLAEWGDSEPIPFIFVGYGQGEWVGEGDLSGTARAMWDEQALYIGLQVRDDRIVQEAPSETLYKGDSVEFYWDRDLVGDFESQSYNADDLQAAISAGDFASRGADAWVWAPASVGNFREEINIAGQRTAEGYTMEFSIPWRRLGVTPLPGAYFGYALALSDDDTPGGADQETQMSTSNRLPYNNPHHWGNLILRP